MTAGGLKKPEAGVSPQDSPTSLWAVFWMDKIPADSGNLDSAIKSGAIWLRGQQTRLPLASSLLDPPSFLISLPFRFLRAQCVVGAAQR